MRMLLNFVKGCTSFESIRTINGVKHKTYREECYALGLLDDDKEWNDCLADTSIWATGNELRHLFVTILIHCQVFDSSMVWKNNYEILSEDIPTLQRKRLRMKILLLSQEQIEAYTLFEIESILLKMGKSLQDIDGMPIPDSALLRNVVNCLINEELDYDKDELKRVHETTFSLLNDCQKIAYDAIITSVEKYEGRLFFINGHEGTALLLPNGRTAHSRFHIPLDVTAESTCEIKQGSQLAELLNGKVSPSEAIKFADFDKWLLQVGDGSFYDDSKKELIKIPQDVRINTSNNPICSIIEAVYPSLLQKYNDPGYFKEREILTPKNEMVHELNETIMKMISGEGRTYFSADNVCKASVNTNDEEILYPTKFLNNLRIPGIPNHDIHLKVGTPVMLLRNINQTEGLCNGTRLIVTNLGIWSVTANIILGKNIGSRLTIPRIIMSPTESKWPFKLKR
ncbi:uncharacterized protein LOC132619465 [Lycium barbarum]|uniref:uncharacterized protein LOC132619465 n=1 Tax=Lycium barbarum TaxID=112863 RepID=UPI00293E46A5|nr:uncharacterized protein LOC132619465 [Lycium barbarum]